MYVDRHLVKQGNKLDIPDFHGMDPEIFLDCLTNCDNFYMWYMFNENSSICYGKIEGRSIYVVAASKCLEDLAEVKLLLAEMKQLIRFRFLPLDCTQKICQKFYKFTQGDRMIVT